MASAAVEYDLWRQTLADGEITTVYCVRHPLAATAVRVLHFPEPRRLDVVRGQRRRRGDRRRLLRDDDREGFSADAAQFDSDITDIVSALAFEPRG
jgi:hypothetical protein